LKRDEVVFRARRTIGHGTLYRLGAGAPQTAPHPWDETGACDCSGFVCWVLGISRYQPMFSFLKIMNGGWMNTDGMVCDAMHPTGYFEPVTDEPLPGDIVVYPSAWYAKQLKETNRSSCPRIGHVGLISVANGRASRVIHCSSGNYRTHSDAIQETDLTIFTTVHYHRLLRFCGLE
jgi:cell wall-associated NlpC family hydrolase